MTGPAPVYVLTPTRRDMRGLVEHMRPLDWHEVSCVYARSPERMALADAIFGALGQYLFARVVSVSPMIPPDAFIGVVALEGAGLAMAHMFATRRFARVARGCTEFIAHELTPHLLAEGVRRVEVRAWEGNGPAIRWLRRLGAAEECRLPGYGRDGETFVQFAWRSEDVLRATETAKTAAHG